MNYREKYLYVGLDLHKNTNTAVIINCWKDVIDTVEFENRPAAFQQFLDKVLEHSIDLTPVFGLEDIGGNGRRLANFLLEKHQIVKQVNAALTAESRRKKATVRKTDSIDALCVAKELIEGLNELPDAVPDDYYWTLNQFILRRNTLVKDMVKSMEKLHAQLYCSYPRYQDFFSKIDGQTALEFWDKYPSPRYLEGVTLEELTQFIRKASNNSLSTRKAEAILELVNLDGITERDYQLQRDYLVRSHVREIKFLKVEIEGVEEKIKDLMGNIELKLNTIKGVDIVTAASLAAEIGDISKFSTSDKLASFAGLAPVPYQSGDQQRNIINKFGNRELHSIVYFLAVRQIQVAKKTRKPANPVMHEYYLKKISEGKTKQQAVICVARRLISIIFSIMKNGTEYMIPVYKESA